MFVGIDVSKKQLDVAVRPTGETWAVANDQPGCSELAARLATVKPEVVVLEATGGLETVVATVLAAAGLPVVVVNPRQVRSFAKALNQLAKTDRIDAALLAHFGEAVKPKPTPIPDENAHKLSELLTRRRQVVEMIATEKNRLASMMTKEVRQRLMNHLHFLKMELKDVDNDLDTQIRDTPAWREKVELLQTAPGVAKVVSRALVGELPELGTLSGKEIAALVGVAPYNCDSGTLRGKRRIWGGRAYVRSLLYMAAISASRYSPQLRVFYRRLRDAGKPARVAIIAVARKLLITLNAMVRDQRPWQAEAA